MPTRRTAPLLLALALSGATPLAVPPADATAAPAEDEGADASGAEEADASATSTLEAERPSALPRTGLGVGATLTLSGVAGPAVSLWTGRLLLEGVAGFTLQAPDAGDSTLRLGVAGGVAFALVHTDPADLYLGMRLALETLTGDTGGTTVSIELPLRVQWFPLPHLSLHAEVGAVLELARPGGGSATLDLGRTSVAGGAGFTYSF